MKSLLYFSAKVGIEDAFKRKIQEDSLHVSTVDRSKHELCHFQIFVWHKSNAYISEHSLTHLDSS